MTGEAAEWRPNAGLAALKRRAAMLAELRAFFAERGVLEVETPLLSAETTPDLHLEPLSSRVDAPGVECRRMYLQTSPELAMKRLLAAGSGSIYQVCKAFRGGERGRWHNPEFTILEWYRVGWDVHRLMREVAALIETLLAGSRRLEPAVYASYAELLQRHAEVDPYDSPTEALRRAVEDTPSPVDTSGLDRDDLLSRLFGERVEPRFAPDRVTVVFGYPASQAAMARLNASDPRTAERFEAYVGEIELANGYGELCDPVEQRQRLERDLASRRGTGRPPLPMPSRFLAALESGLPHCAGVALGLDRLLGLDLQAGSIDELIAFPLERA
ncbi:MAG: EF-P lysine aminoacylase GenX [Holophagales bacterium]|nr:EF-P lysine aminoacylase GenX [Holophagales bacterium]MYD22217.1 EF-P lysine aminoacylase GenX [Holophagales bacterium]MYI33524.1 EF-P lysine aminoacylase GenX [Holophagales bacterium]